MKTRETEKASSQVKGPGRKPNQRSNKIRKPGSGTRPEGDGEHTSAGTGSPADNIGRLAKMTIGELQALYAEVRGEKTRCPNRAWLIRNVKDAAGPVAADTSAALPPAAEGTAAPSPVAGEAATEAAVGLKGGPANEEATHVPAVEPAAPTGRQGADPTADTAGAGSPALPKLSKLDVPALRALYAEICGAPHISRYAEAPDMLSPGQGSEDRGASRGVPAPHIPGPNGKVHGGRYMVLPVRLEAGVVARLDETWRRLGHGSRMDFFRRALCAYLLNAGEDEVAALLAPKGRSSSASASR